MSESQSSILENYNAHPWVERLGVSSPEVSESNLQLSLPFRRRNTNTGGSVHGGIIANLAYDAGSLLASHSFSAPIRPLNFQITFLRGAKQTALRATARAIRQTKNILFVLIDVVDDAQQPIAMAQAQFTACGGKVDLLPKIEQQLEEKSVPAHGLKNVFAPAIQKWLPGMSLEQMGAGYARMSLKPAPLYLLHDQTLITGPQFIMVDNVGAFASISNLHHMAQGATTQLGITWFNASTAEELICAGHAVAIQGSQASAEVKLFSRQSLQLMAVAQVSIWLKY